MSENEFKTRANNLTDIEEIDELCLDWLRDAAKEQSPKEREIIESALEVLTRGIE